MSQKQVEISIVLNPKILISKERENEIWSVGTTRACWDMLKSMDRFKKMCPTKEQEEQKKKSIMESAIRLVTQKGMSFDKAMQKSINSYIKVFMIYEDTKKA